MGIFTWKLETAEIAGVALPPETRQWAGNECGALVHGKVRIGLCVSGVLFGFNEMLK